MFIGQSIWEKAKTSFPLAGVYEESFCEGNGFTCFLVQTANEDALLIQGKGSFFNELKGEIVGDLKLCPLTHTNRVVVNRHLPFTAPTPVAHNKITFGFGDRLGLANTAHLMASQKANIIPVLAQQSMRELNLTGRSYDNVLDTAAWAVLRRGWKSGYGADGDHLKTKAEIRGALDSGFTMITLDCSDYLEKAPAPGTGELAAAYQKISPGEQTRFEEAYLKPNAETAALVQFTENALMRAILVYHKAIDFIVEVYSEIIKPVGRSIDFEISIDETGEKTELADHVFVAAELRRRCVVISGLAPCFIGEFQKGIDYIGDVAAFAADLRGHCAIAKHFGYKISVHSGSDKYKVFPAIAKETGGHFHIKTSGTSWLAAVTVIAKKAPALYRRMHQCALDHFEEARKFYVVHCDPAEVAPLAQVSDQELPAYMEQDHGRQLLHIAYGFILADPVLKRELFATLTQFKSDYDNELCSLMGKHLSLLTAK